MTPTKETREKISKALTGCRKSQETRRRMSLACLGRHHSEETKEKIRLGNLGKYVSQKTRKKLSLARAGRSHEVTEETREKISLGMLGYQNTLGFHHTEESKEKIRLAILGYKMSEETKEKIILAHKQLWQNPRHAKKIIKGMCTRPTRPEEKIMQIIEDYDLPFNYNGNNGNIIVAGKCPDFVSKDDSKCIIEVFGNYWHEGELESYKTNLYEKEGYKTLILWEDEIKSSEDSYLAYLIIHLMVKSSKRSRE